MSKRRGWPDGLIMPPSPVLEFLTLLGLVLFACVVAMLITSCSAQAQQRKADIERAEDQFCAARAAQKAAQQK